MYNHVHKLKSVPLDKSIINFTELTSTHCGGSGSSRLSPAGKISPQCPKLIIYKEVMIEVQTGY